LALKLWGSAKRRVAKWKGKGSEGEGERRGGGKPSLLEGVLCASSTTMADDTAKESYDDIEEENEELGYVLPDDAGFVEYALYPWRSLEGFFERFNRKCVKTFVTLLVESACVRMHKSCTGIGMLIRQALVSVSVILQTFASCIWML